MPRHVALACCLRPTHALPTLLMALGVFAQASLAATADPVWRCSTAPGSAVTYQSTPCRDGGQALPAGKRPTPEDREASARVAEREADLARSMGKQRARREKAPPPAHASLSGPVRQVSVGRRDETQVKSRDRASDRTTQRTRQRRHDVFRAEVPGRSRQHPKPHQVDAVSASPP